METLNQNPIQSFSSTKVDFLSIKNIVLMIMVIVLGLIYLPRKIINPGTISVIGVGKMSIIPKSVSLIVTKVNVGNDPTITISNSSAEINMLINEARKIVGQDAEIQKSFYTTSLTNNGLQVTNGFKVTFNNISKINDLIKSLYSNGATSVSNILFMPENKETTAQGVKKLALEEAKKQAENAIKLSGKRIGKIVSISDDNNELGGTVASGGGEVGTGDINITKTITVVYEMW